MSDLTLIKFGGSVLTDKSGHEAARQEVVERLSRELASTEIESVILGHGSGSFGHRAAIDAGVVQGRFNAADVAAAVATQRAARRLHLIVLEAFDRAGLATASFTPASWCSWVEGELQALSVLALEGALRSGALPVVMGDVVWSHSGGARIASTEEVFLTLAAEMPVGRAIWVGETDGILDADGRTIANLSPNDQPSLAPVDRPDVTGGMNLRWSAAQQLAERGVESLLINGLRPGELTAAIKGDAISGSRVLPD